MPAINVSQEAHSAAKTAAESAGMGMGEWVSRRLLEESVRSLSWMDIDAVVKLSEERSETAAETLKKALTALTTPLPAVVPEKKIVAVWADGRPPCKCDGLSDPGPWHKSNCHRRTE